MKIRTALYLGVLSVLALAILVAVAIELVALRAAAQSLPWHSALVLTSLVAVAALGMAFALHSVCRTLASRIRLLEQAVRQVSAGCLEPLPAIPGEDETALISSVIGEMVAALREYVQLIPAHERLKNELDKLNQSVELLRGRNMDVSDSLQRLRRAQSQILERERLSLMGRMFVPIAREVEGVLSSILGIAERAAAAAAALPPETRRDYTLIADGARRARATLRRCAELDDAAAQPADQLDLRAVISEALALTEPRWKDRTAGRAPIELRLQIKDPVPVLGKHSELVQLFVALIDNALDAMPRGGTLDIRAARADTGAVSVVLSDTGAGMNAATLKRCFKPFFSTKEGAAGIGLSLAQAIVEHHRGRIGIESQPEIGTTVFIDLPNAPAAAAPAPPPAAPPLRILLVDDDPWTRDILSAHLQHAGHRVEAVPSGTAALKGFRPEACDLLITDCAMPDLSGDELAREIKALAPDLPVLMLSGYGVVLRERGEKPTGVDLVLPKPVTAEDLRAAVAQLARRRRPAAAAAPPA